MLEAAEKCDFEKAAKYRDYIDSITFLISREKVIEFTQETKNIAIVEPIDDHTIKFFLINGNKVVINEKYNIEFTDVDRLRAIISLDIFGYFKRNKIEITTEVTQDDIDEAQIIYSYLESSSCHYIIISEKWLDTGNTEKVDEAIGQLLHY